MAEKSVSLEIEVLEHVADEFVVIIATETLQTTDETLERVAFWIRCATADGIKTFLKERLNEYPQGEEISGLKESLTAGVTINLCQSQDGEMLVQVHVPYDYESRLLLRNRVHVEPWNTSDDSSELAMLIERECLNRVG